MSGIYVCRREGWGESGFLRGWGLHIEGWGIWLVWSRGTYCPIGYKKIRRLITLSVVI